MNNVEHFSAHKSAILTVVIRPGIGGSTTIKPEETNFRV